MASVGAWCGFREKEFVSHALVGRKRMKISVVIDHSA
jgi:hypothetical protein